MSGTSIIAQIFVPLTSGLVLKNRSESSFVCTYSDDSREPAHRRALCRNDVI